MDLKLEQSLFRKNQAEGIWIVPDAVIGFELIIPGKEGQPDHDSILLAQPVVDRLKELKDQAASVLRSKLTFQGEYIFEGFRILPQPDRHGTKIIFNFTNAEDAYLWIEAGISEDRFQKYRVEYALSTYYFIESEITAGAITSERAGVSPFPKEQKSRTEYMKKRLRKKLHRDEFTEWGRQFIITRKRKDEFDEFLDAFIEMIEANGCVCGGGGMGDNLNVMIELGRRPDDRDARMKSVTAWLEARPDVQSWKVGAEVDLWNGNFDEISG